MAQLPDKQMHKWQTWIFDLSIWTYSQLTSTLFNVVWNANKRHIIPIHLPQMTLRRSGFNTAKWLATAQWLKRRTCIQRACVQLLPLIAMWVTGDGSKGIQPELLQWSPTSVGTSQTLNKELNYVISGRRLVAVNCQETFSAAVEWKNFVRMPLTMSPLTETVAWLKVHHISCWWKTASLNLILI